MATLLDPIARSDHADLVTPSSWRRRLGRLLVLFDAVIIGSASLLAYALRDSLGRLTALEPFASEVPAAIAVLPLWLALLYTAGAYDSHHFSSGASGLRRFFAGVAAGTVALGFISFLFNLQLSRLYVATVFALVVLLGGLARVLLLHHVRRAWKRGEHIQHVLIAGINDESLEVARAIARHPESGYRIAGFVDDAAVTGTEVEGLGPVVGGIDGAIGTVARQQGAGLVIISPSAVAAGTLQEVTIALEGSEIDLAIAPSLFEVVTRRVAVESIGSVPILQVAQVRLEGMRALAKRTLDIAAALALLVVLWPVMLLAAVAVRRGSLGPALLRQTRIGKDGVPFTMYKFRTMSIDANMRFGDVVTLNEAGHHFFKVREDPRVTKQGRFLRKWSIDEAPQLVNVLRGDMSFVGPRPPLPREVARYEPWHTRRLRVRPGLTGLWQVSGRANIPFNEAVRLDLFYIENWSVGLDLTIVARTVRAVLGRDGAY